jgi:hypothetical protein
MEIKKTDKFAVVVKKKTKKIFQGCLLLTDCNVF